MFEHRHSESDLLAFGPATRAVPHVELGLPRSSLYELPVDISRNLPRYMPRKHRYPFVPIRPFNRSARILWPRLNLEATVPMEQCRAFAICS